MPRAYSQDLRWRAIWLTKWVFKSIKRVSYSFLSRSAVSLKNTRYRILVIIYALKLDRNYYAQYIVN